MKAKRSRGSGSLYRPKGSNNWWIQIYADGKRHREPTGMDNKRKAENILRDKIAEVTTGSFNTLSHKVTVAELVKMKYTADSNDGNKSLDDDEARWRIHLEPVFGSLLASRLTTPMLDKYVAGRREAGAKNGTINRELSLLRASFHKGFKSTPALVRAVPHFPMLQENNVRKGFLSDAQYDTLGAECIKHGIWLRTIMEVGATYGWRSSEITNLRVHQVDIPGKTIRLNPGETKNNDGREVAITANLLPLLAGCIEGKKSDDYVFTRPDGCRVKSFRTTWRNVCIAAGVPTLYVHDLRRTAARNLRRAGVAEGVIMKIGGWRTRSMFDRYAIVSSADMKDAMAKLEASKAEVKAKELSDSQSLAKDAPETGQLETRPN
jgi:integrase